MGEKEYCKWIPEGNGHYSTKCGGLFYDKGRLRTMNIRVYGSNKPLLPIIKKCPKCGGIVKDNG